MVQLVLQLGAWVLPRAVVRLVEEGGERGELVHLKERAQLEPRGIDVLKAIRPHSARALLRASGETACANARVGVSANHQHVALVGVVALGEHRTKGVIVFLPLGCGGSRGGRVTRYDKDAKLAPRARIQREETSGNDARSGGVPFAVGIFPGGCGVSAERDAHARGTTALLRVWR